MSTVHEWGRLTREEIAALAPDALTRPPGRHDRAARAAPRDRHRRAHRRVRSPACAAEAAATAGGDPARPDARLRRLAPPPPVRRHALARRRHLPARAARPARLRRRGGLQARLRRQRPRRQRRRVRDRGRPRPSREHGIVAATALIADLLEPGAVEGPVRGHAGGFETSLLLELDAAAFGSTARRPSPGGASARAVARGLVVARAGTLARARRVHRPARRGVAPSAGEPRSTPACGRSRGASRRSPVLTPDGGRRPTIAARRDRPSSRRMPSPAFASGARASSHDTSSFVLVRVITDEGVEGYGEVSATAAWSGEDHVTATPLRPRRVRAAAGRRSRSLPFEATAPSSTASSAATGSRRRASTPRSGTRSAGRSVGPSRRCSAGRSGARSRRRSRSAATATTCARATRPRVGARLPRVQGQGRARSRRRCRPRAAGAGARRRPRRSSASTPTAAGRRRAALATVPRLAELGIAFVEQPVAADDLEGMRPGARARESPSSPTSPSTPPPTSSASSAGGAADVVSIYVGKSSGPSSGQSRRRALAASLGAGVVIGSNGEMGIGAAAQLHVACACEQLGVLPCGIIGHHFYDDDRTLEEPLVIEGSVGPAAGRARPRSAAERGDRAELRRRERRRAGLRLPGGARASSARTRSRSRWPGSAATPSAWPLVYHRARRVFPRHRHVSVLAGQRPRTSRPDPRRYGALVPDAIADPALRGRRRSAFARPAGRRASRSARGSWLCITRRSRPATPSRGARPRRRPLGHSLCPSAPEAVEYVAALAGDVAAQLEPETRRPRGVALSGLGAVVHADARPRAALRRARAARHAVLLRPLPPAARRAADELEQRARRRRSPVRAPGDDAGRRRAIRSCGRAGDRRGPLVARSHQCTRRASELRAVRLRASGAGAPAGSLARSRSSVADSVLLGCARLAGDELQARFAGLRRAVGSPTPMVSTTGRPSARRPRWPTDVGRLVAAGADGLALYNLSLVPDEGSTRSARRRPPSTQRCPPDDGPRRPRHDRREQGRLARGRRSPRDDGRARDRPRARSPRRRGTSRCATARATSSSREAAAGSGGQAARLRRRDAVARGGGGRRARAGARRSARARSSSIPRSRASTSSTGSVDPLVAFAVERGWPVYVRTGTPPHSLPLQVALLGLPLSGRALRPREERRHRLLPRRAGRARLGGQPVRRQRARRMADRARRGRPGGVGGRVVFTTDAPFGDPAVELARVTEAPLDDAVRAAVLGGTLAGLLGL